MANIGFSRLMITPKTITASFFGLLLLISAFLPWMSPTAKLGSFYSSASGTDVSVWVTLTAILGGLLIIILAWLPLRGARGGLHIVLGLAVIGVLALLLFNKTLPLLSSVVRSYVSTGFGVYLYAVSGLAVAIIGVAELPKRRPKMRPQAQPSYPPQSYGTPMQPYQAIAPTAAFCGNCGAPHNPGAAFCAGCGTPIKMAAPTAPIYGQPAYQAAPVAQYQQKVSGAWWLLPIFLGVLGGLIAFFGVLRRRPGMAVVMLIVGIAVTVVEVILIMNAINSFTDSFIFVA